ncbi:hypothetical protein L915_01838 [Phytophthora nicotianae]|uniref:Uncharacterized protein n=1 Tax=Phytophthora nicotianae TaxID=4792 RepID=W2JQF3_PHYNI|nr:hypothetical protein L915_01838 [Phytophthora nicotianae]ETL48601.1 hypothetical protein L916_01803 [Phytophthora nicotianae]
MFKLNSLKARMNELIRLHQQLIRRTDEQENRVTMTPAEENKVHGFALTINPLMDVAQTLGFVLVWEHIFEIIRAASGTSTHRVSLLSLHVGRQYTLPPRSGHGNPN